jgi:ABC-2 type transport system ATP-binding protein
LPIKENIHKSAIAPQDIIDPDNGYAIKLKNLSKKYDDILAVNNLNLEIKSGELFSLLGPNGAGKTTTINILNGLVKPTKGTATIGGYDVLKNLNYIKELIGVCPQEPALYKFLSGKENLELFGHLNKMSKVKIKERMEYFIELLDFSEAIKRKVRGYSGGMLRKLNILVALIHDPKIVFLDEPTVGMDPRTRRKVWEFIGSLKNQNKTIILTTHYIEEAEALSDRVGIIDYGELIELDTAQKLMEKHKSKNLEEVFLKITGRRILEGI